MTRDTLPVRSEFEAYVAGKADTIAALHGQKPMKCSLNAEEQKQKNLMAHWGKGVRHQCVQVEASVPVIGVEARRIMNEATK